jgi:predicted nucleic acid-binding protein
MILLDTNVLSEVMRKEPSPIVLNWLDAQLIDQLWVSSISRAEIFLGIALLPEGKRRIALHDAATAMFTEDFQNPCLAFEALAADAYADVVMQRRQQGRPISVEDALIAAIAYANGLKLATRNTSDFIGIRGLELIDPWLQTESTDDP